MKKYKKVELVAKNQLAGSYAAGCPSKNMGSGCFLLSVVKNGGCKACERSK